MRASFSSSPSTSVSLPRPITLTVMRQGEVVAAVDGRVQTSLIAILSIAGLAIAITSALSWHLVRTVTRRLNAAVEGAAEKNCVARMPASVP